MIDTKRCTIKHLDLIRRMFGVGLNCELLLLTHSVAKGYFPLSIAVPGGWTLEDSGEGQSQTLIIYEDDWVDDELLRQVKAFSIAGRVYEIVGSLRVGGPTLGSTLREWTWIVSPTGEVYP